MITARIGKHGNPTRALNSSTYVTTAVYVVLGGCRLCSSDSLGGSGALASSASRSASSSA
ncbi:MAG: hypothetical protein R2912_05810 [Eubacteriales bacterium]